MKKDYFDYLLEEFGPSAIVYTNYLTSAEGNGEIVFPPTYAGEGKGESVYNISPFFDGKNRCTIDSIASQSNRIEPLFKKYPKLVKPVKIEGYHICDIPHRSADTFVRVSSLSETFEKAYLDLKEGNYTPLVKLAPTSLVFGAWDSRNTQVKIPRIFTSRIDAYDVQTQERSMSFNPIYDYRNEDEDVKTHIKKKKDSKDANKALSNRGFNQAVSSGELGGVCAKRENIKSFSFFF